MIVEAIIATTIPKLTRQRLFIMKNLAQVLGELQENLVLEF